MPVITTAWAAAVNGDFNTASNWTNGVPAAGDTALITAKGTYTITSGMKANSVATLAMAKGATVGINDFDLAITQGSETAALAGTIDVNQGTSLALGTSATDTAFNNTGSIALNGSPKFVADLIVAGNVTLNGKGKIELQNGDGQIVSDGSAATLTNSNTISGAGTIGDSHLTQRTRPRASSTPI